MNKEFLNQKKQALEKLDKSFIGSIDKKINNLCNIINKRDDMYTLSSCSGRICILNKENDRKKENIWLFVNHDITNLKEFKESIKNVNNEIELRQESAIIHIACENTKLAKKLLHIGKISGFNQVGIISLNSKIIIELICDIQYIIPCKKELLNDYYLEYFINKSNENLIKSWDAIEKLEKQISDLKSVN